MLDWLSDIRIADIVDIALVTTLLYTAIVLLRRTQAAFVAIGLLMLGGLYVAARAIDLRLTAWLLQGFFAVFIVILVVIFQEELRQLFERIALWSLRRGGAKPLLGDSNEVIVRCLSDFSRDRIGALIVLPGRQPLERYIRGGNELEGRLSEPLLKSIFDPHSAGHDGAVIIERDRVTRFAAHLPLSSDFAQLGRVGTRHSAALGLAELTDALCLIVSEERGDISIARDGVLRRLAGPEEVARELAEYHRAMHPERRGRQVLIPLLRENWVEKLASVALVIGLWYLFVPGSRPATFEYSVPVKVANLASNLELEKVEPPEVTVVFTGLKRAFYLFDRKQLEVTVDASLARHGRRTFSIADSDVRYPKELTLEEVRPPRVRIEVRSRDRDTETETNGSAEKP